MGPSETKRASKIALIEDSVADVKIAQRALELARVSVDLIVFRDGEEALSHLKQCADQRNASPNDSLTLQPAEPDATVSLPDLVLLDLNLPRLTGFEVLNRIRSTPALQFLPVVVLSTSSHPNDVRRAYALGANSYLEKPRELEQFVAALKLLCQYWLELTLLPRF